MSAVARTGGTCEDCQGPIQVGDSITLAGGAGWVHDPCPAEPKRGEVCTVCFMEKALNGSCGCES